jgi:uncharacterized membrane protein
MLMLGRLTWVLLAALIAFSTHIAYVMFVPPRAFEKQLAREILDLAPNAIRILSPEQQRALLPSYRGDSVIAVCALDVRRGPVKLTAHLPQSYWMAAIHSFSGVQVYSINDAEAESETIDVQISQSRGLLSQVLEGGEGEDATDVTNAGWNVELPEPRGIAVIWVPLADPLVRPDVEATLGKSKCAETSTLPKP